MDHVIDSCDAQMLQDCMQIDEAIQMFQKAIDLQPNIASTYVYLGYECGFHGYCYTMYLSPGYYM